jgi:hypothetical protein
MSELHHSEHLQRYYDYEWRFRHNIGADLLIVTLAKLMPIELAGRLVVAAIPLLTLTALVWIRLKVHGRVDSVILLSAPFAMSTWFGWGFINYCLSLALALLAFAAWLEIRRLRLALRSAALLAMGVAVWLTHLSGWGILCILVFAWEAHAALEARTSKVRKIVTGLWEAGVRCLPLAAPVLIQALSPGESTWGVIQWDWAGKLSAPNWSLAFTWDRVDRYCVILIAGMVAVALLARVTKASGGLALASALLLAAYLLAPTSIFGATSIDLRIFAAFALIATTTITWRTSVDAHWRKLVIVAITLGAFAVSFGRLSYTAIAFQRYESEITQNLALIEHMPAGARVLTIVVDGLNGGRPPLTLLPAMSVVRRDAFSNSQWEEDAGHTLVLRYWHELPYAVGGETTVSDLDDAGQSTGALNRLIAAEPLERFDFVWIINTHRAGPVRSSDLVLVDQTRRTALYRVEARPHRQRDVSRPFNQ